MLLPILENYDEREVYKRIEYYTNLFKKYECEKFKYSVILGDSRKKIESGYDYIISSSATSAGYEIEEKYNRGEGKKLTRYYRMKKMEK